MVFKDNHMLKVTMKVIGQALTTAGFIKLLTLILSYEILFAIVSIVIGLFLWYGANTIIRRAENIRKELKEMRKEISKNS